MWFKQTVGLCCTLGYCKAGGSVVSPFSHAFSMHPWAPLTHPLTTAVFKPGLETTVLFLLSLVFSSVYLHVSMLSKSAGKSYWTVTIHGCKIPCTLLHQGSNSAVSFSSLVVRSLSLSLSYSYSLCFYRTLSISA